MSNHKKNHELIRKNEQTVKSSQKHDANLQKNSTLYFQIGLIVCLLAAYGLFEMKVETDLPRKDIYAGNIDLLDEIAVKNVRVFEETMAETKPKVIEKKVVLINNPTIVDDTYKIEIALKIDTAEQNTSSKPVDPNALVVLNSPEVIDDYAFKKVEQVPIYPGCENRKSNEDKRKCMSDKINKLVQRKFDTGLGSELGLSGRQVIQTQFKIDKMGRVRDIKTRAAHPKLQEEAERVINTLPEMTPGKQRDKNVGVIYNLPIVFRVDN